MSATEMGARGPARTPTSILKARGSWLADRNPREPTPQRGRPVCPRWISARAKRVWQALVPQLDAMGVLCLVDRNALVRYVTLYARWRECEEFLQKHGLSYPQKDRDGRVTGFKAFPQAKLAEQIGATLGRLEQQFGLTPASRSRLEVPRNEKEESDDPKAKFIKFPAV